MVFNIKTIIYATTLGAHTRPVFRAAVKQAIVNHARIVMVYAAEPMTEFGHALVESYLPEADRDRLARDGKRQLLATMKSRVQAFCHDELNNFPESRHLQIDYVVEEAAPSELIVATADEMDADMIVIGSHNQSSISRMLMGSTARKVMDTANRPVLVVPNN